MGIRDCPRYPSGSRQDVQWRTNRKVLEIQLLGAMASYIRQLSFSVEKKKIDEWTTFACVEELIQVFLFYVSIRSLTTPLKRLWISQKWTTKSSSRYIMGSKVDPQLSCFHRVPQSAIDSSWYWLLRNWSNAT